jgi:hypothetical protein
LVRRATTTPETGVDTNSIVLTVHNQEDLPALWAYVSSSDYHTQVRLISKTLKVQGDLISVPFDREHYRDLAANIYRMVCHPTQWLFHGHPANAEIGTALHIGLARLSGYQWSAEAKLDMRLSARADEWIAKAATLPSSDNGLMALPAVAGERALPDRLARLPRDGLRFRLV